MGEAKRKRDTKATPAPMQGPDGGPIQPELHALMNSLAGILDETFNGPPDGRAPDAVFTGFFLAVFPSDGQGRFNYISNAEKLDVRVMLKDVLARIEGRMSREGRA